MAMPPLSLDDLPTPALRIDAEGVVRHANVAARAMLGNALTGLFDTDTLDRLRSPAGLPVPIRLAGNGADWLGTACALADGETLVLLIPATAIAERLAGLEQLASTDGLTGLPNRRHFFDLAAREQARAARRGTGTALLLLDVDRFKSVNDAHGHPAGDRLLHWLGTFLRGQLRLGDTPARIGGEEFAILLPDTSAHDARAIAGRIRAGLALAGPPCAITISIGIAAGATDMDRLYAEADRQLYQAKQQGGDAVCG